VTSDPGSTPPADETAPLPTGAERSKPRPRPKARRPASPPPSGPPPTATSGPSEDAAASGSEAERLRAEIEATRAQLGDTVDALSAKLDVKGRVDEKRAEVTDTVKAKIDEGVATAKQGVGRVQEVATDDQGKPTTPAVGAAAGAGALLLLLLLLRRRRRKRRNTLD
jgi:MYXO-CTERM domain-containing protein